MKLALDGSGSTDSAGNTLLGYAWYVTSSPTQSNCGENNGQKCFDHPTAAAPNFTPDVAGLYGILLVVGDQVVGGATASAITTVQVAGAARLTVTAGGGQTGTVGQALASPITVKLTAADGATGIANQQLVWFASDGALTPQNNGVTDANGDATATLQVGRIAGSGTVTVYLQGDPTITATTGFTAAADKPASIALGSAVGDADHGVAITVTVVDRYGNPATATTAQASASVTLAATSPSKKATFGSTATTGSITSGGGTAKIVAKLSGGSFIGKLNDTVAEQVSVDIGLNAATGSPLPFSAWTTLFSHGAESDSLSPIWTANGGPPAWAVESTVVHTGGAAYGLSATPVDEMTGWTSTLVSNPLAPPGGSVLTVLSLWAQTTVASAYDSMNHCQEQPQFAIGLRDDMGNSVVVPPTGGYQVLDTCANLGPAFGPLSTWTQETFDVTDSIGAYPSVVLDANDSPDPGTSLAGPSSFEVDDVLVQSLGTPSFAGATGNEIVNPGAVAKVAFSAAAYGGSANMKIGECLNEPQTDLSITVETIDQYGNVTTGTPTVEVDWTGAATASDLATGTLVAIMPHGMQIQLSYGQATLTLSDTQSETANLTMTAVSPSNLTVGSSSTAQFARWYCHTIGDAFGSNLDNWSDGTPVSTYNEAEALNACQTFVQGAALPMEGSGQFTCDSTQEGYVMATPSADSCQAGWLPMAWYYGATTCDGSRASGDVEEQSACPWSCSQGASWTGSWQ